MYAPTPDRSGEILANAGTNAAQIRAQGTIAAAQSVSDAITNISNMYMKQQEKAQENRIASDGANAKFDMLKTYKKTDGTSLVSQEMIEKFDTMPLGKRQAYVQTAEAMMEHDLKKWMYQTQYNYQANRINANMLAQQPTPNQQPVSTGNAGTAPAASSMGGINFNYVK